MSVSLDPIQVPRNQLMQLQARPMPGRLTETEADYDWVSARGVAAKFLGLLSYRSIWDQNQLHLAALRLTFGTEEDHEISPKYLLVDSGHVIYHKI